MSNSRGGFFSLNRLLGKKHKNEKNLSNSLSKSSFQTLTRSTTNLEEISPQNKIVPAVAVSNAPFEQLFRITVYLPLGQLYVARIGAKTKLSELLHTICVDKSLDSNKFEFKHPTDDTQVFDLNFTVGEVGLNEIKLMQKNSKEDMTVRYRMHSTNQDNRHIARPHTMSSVSPYSSSNSLNSSDSLGMMNQRLNNSNIPAAHNRKKRVAPRPPSQILECPENQCTGSQTSHTDAICEVGLERSNLARQNFYVSSPNLAVNNNVMQRSISSNDTITDSTISGSFERRQSENTNRKTASNRPLSIQLSKTTSENQQIERTNSTCSQNHSRTSSESSDITRYSHLPEPQPRKRPPIGKKKAPAPPPRTISAISNGVPIATPRNVLQKLGEEEVNGEMSIVEDHSADVLQTAQSLPNVEAVVLPVKNVSKVMLNVSETSTVSAENSIEGNADGRKVGILTRQNTENDGNSFGNETLNVSKPQITCSEAGQTLDSHIPRSNCNKVSVVDLNGLDSKFVGPKIDHDDISEQVNEIIDEAVKINEAKLNAENDRKNHEKDETFEPVNEINNNEQSNNDTLSENNCNCNEYACKAAMKNPNIGSGALKINSMEVPIQPILNETRTFSFHEYNDNSLPTSTTSTLNTTETPSTGPESLITSDIEDGYKGNEMDKKRKVEVLQQDSKEDFIESQFEFLQEHLDSRTNTDSDEEKTFDFIQKRDIISSTMIADKSNETYRIPQSLDKTDVINELTQIINCNRLDTFIKPNNESNDSVEASKQSSLSNFHISVYSNGSHDKDKSKKVSCNYSIDGQSSEKGVLELGVQPIMDDSQTNPLENDSNKQTETFVVSKQVGRSMSFHSTFSNIEESLIDSNTGGLSDTPRSNSYLSLNDDPNRGICDNKPTTNRLMEMSRQKSTSELSIADTPSLQSIEIMKSILNRSKISPDCSTDIQIREHELDFVENGNESDNQRKSQENEEKVYAVNTSKVESNNQTKTWKYQGPPAINFSTWGERPKSMVHIKSDNDYIFGGTSKMAALQKRFNGLIEENRNDAWSSANSPISGKSESQCESSSCKLPIVRSVEYKKNVLHSNIDTVVEDTPDSTPQINSFRTSYEVSRIVSEKSFSDNTSHSNSNTSATSKSFENNDSKTGIVQRVQSFNCLSETQTIKQLNGAKEKMSTKQPKMPMFTQFTLRKTGLKEKMLDECNTNKINPIDKIDNKTGNKLQANVKINPIPTAPKPPPILKKPKVRPVSMGDIRPDPRNQLLDSIRNFNRDTLKR